MENQKGFTLIELVMVIIILGILSATALPKFIDLKSDAQRAAVDGVAGGLAAGSAINKGARQANSAKGITITACADAAGLLDGGLDSTKYTLSTGSVSSGGTVQCSVSDTNTTSMSATFTLHAIT